MIPVARDVVLKILDFPVTGYQILLNKTSINKQYFWKKDRKESRFNITFLSHPVFAFFVTESSNARSITSVLKSLFSPICGASVAVDGPAISFLSFLLFLLLSKPELSSKTAKISSSPNASAMFHVCDWVRPLVANFPSRERKACWVLFSTAPAPRNSAF